MNATRTLRLLALLGVLAAAPAWAGHVDVGIHVNIDAAVPVPVVLPEPPLFLTPARLGFQVAVGIPEDLFIVAGRYYLFKDDVWRVGPGYNGPWQVVHREHLPPGLRKHRLRDIRAYREREYVIYKKDKDHYRGKRYRPERQDRHHEQNGYRDATGDSDRGNGHDHGHGKKDKDGKEKW